jgi:hypothetical protein
MFKEKNSLLIYFLKKHSSSHKVDIQNSNLKQHFNKHYLISMHFI